MHYRIAMKAKSKFHLNMCEIKIYRILITNSKKHLFVINNFLMSMFSKLFEGDKFPQKMNSDVMGK
jgi:hypothetical protein